MKFKMYILSFMHKDSSRFLNMNVPVKMQIEVSVQAREILL